MMQLLHEGEAQARERVYAALIERGWSRLHASGKSGKSWLLPPPDYPYQAWWPLRRACMIEDHEARKKLEA